VTSFREGGLGRFWTFDERRLRPRNRMLTVLENTRAADIPWDQLPKSKFWPLFARPLDQGNTSSCVGHAWSHFLRMAKIRNLSGPEAMMIYAKAQAIDPWPGEEPWFQGTSTEAGAQVLRDLGYIERFVWPDNDEQMIRFLLTEGPVVVGSNWWSGMDDVDAAGYMWASGQLRGGHCYVIDYWNRVKDEGSVLNSWGYGTWGMINPESGFRTGRAKIKRAVLRDLVFNQAGEACGATELRKVA
jgi:hypothetical protein